MLLFSIGCGFGLAALVKHEIGKQSLSPEESSSDGADGLMDLIKGSGIAADIGFASPDAAIPQEFMDETVDEPDSSIQPLDADKMNDLMEFDDHDDLVSRAMSSLSETDGPASDMVDEDDPNYENLMNSVKKMAGEMDLTPSTISQPEETIDEPETESELLDNDFDFDAIAKTLQKPNEQTEEPKSEPELVDNGFDFDALAKTVQKPAEEKPVRKTLRDEYKSIPVFCETPQELLEVYDCFERPVIENCEEMETVQEIAANTLPELFTHCDIDGMQTDDRFNQTADTIVPLRTRKKARTIPKV